MAMIVSHRHNVDMSARMSIQLLIFLKYFVFRGNKLYSSSVTVIELKDVQYAWVHELQLSWRFSSCIYVILNSGSVLCMLLCIVDITADVIVSPTFTIVPSISITTLQQGE